MLDDTDATPLETYEFWCQHCPDPESRWLDFKALNNERPVCPKCLSVLLPNLAFLRDLEGAQMEDIIISPGLAGLWLSHGFESFKAQTNEGTIQSYVSLMQTNRWVNATKYQGGMYCPIVRIRQYLMLGFNRLEACVKANYTFTNTVLSVI